MNRIMIIGSPGSGKSRLSVQLHEITGLPLYHLDNIWWKPDRTNVTRDEFDRQLAEILDKPQWIIDGDYRRTYQPRFERCDTVVFLDYSPDTCAAGVLERAGTEREDLPWIESGEDARELLETVMEYRKERRPKVLQLLEKYRDREIHVFEDRKQAEKWLSSLKDSL